MACRLYVIPAANAPIAVVFRRGPTKWWHLLQWDWQANVLTPGAWFAGNLYPRRSALSQDGQLLAYFASKPPDPRSPWSAYLAVSRAPWLHALAAWQTVGTWTFDTHFLTPRHHLQVRACLDDEPFHGKYPHRFSCLPMSTAWHKRDVANELRRGWSEVPEANPYQITRPQPNAKKPALLSITHQGHDFRRRAIEGALLDYALKPHNAGPLQLPHIAWADWTPDGSLLAATKSGHLQILSVGKNAYQLESSHDLNPLTPNPQPAPARATRWR